MKSTWTICLYLILSQINCGTFFSSFSFSPISETTYNCFRQAGNNKILIWLFEATNAISDSTVKSVVNAKSAGLSVEALLLPCRNRTAEMEIQILNNAFPFNLFDKFWINPYEGKSSCGWDNYPASSNC